MSSKPNHSNSSILVIDDSVDIHRLLSIRLRDQCAVILNAHSGADGIEMALEAQPDLILLDIDMPDMSGFETLQALKNHPATVQIPVIFLSGSQTTDDKVRGLELGAVDFVTKPFDLAELRARVRSALRTQQLLAMLAQRAQIDGLTGLWNRKYLDNRLNECVSLTSRHPAELSLIFCDIDHFKVVNDTYGHPFGDQVLQEFARLLLSVCRESDVACRYGGEEFAIIAPSTCTRDAAILAERVRTGFETTTWPGRDELRCTASFGVAGLDLGVEPSAGGLIASADKALYEAKHSGRNRVVCAVSSVLMKTT